MRHLRTLVLALVLVAAACGGDDAVVTTAQGNGATNTPGGNDPTVLSADFDLSALPDDFPSNLVPPSWSAGQATDILGPFVVNFETNMSFADAVAYYDEILGPSFVVGDPGEQLAQWSADPTWVASVLEGDPVLVGFTSIAE